MTLTADNAYDQVLKTIRAIPGLTGTLTFTIHEATADLVLTGSFTSNLEDVQQPTELLQLSESTSTGQSGKLEIRGIAKDLYLESGNQAPRHFGPNVAVTSQADGQQQLIDAILVGNLSPFQYADLLQDTPLATSRNGSDYVFTATTKDLDHADDELNGFLTSDEAIQWIETGVRRRFTLSLDDQGRPAGLRVTYTLPKATFDLKVEISGYTGAKTTAP